MLLVTYQFDYFHVLNKTCCKRLNVETDVENPATLNPSIKALQYYKMYVQFHDTVDTFFLKNIF